MHVATSRLIEASEGLDPASRALLNIWIHQDLDDEAIARLSGMSVASVDERRGVIIEKLASELGLPPGDVRDAITRLALPEELEEAPNGAVAAAAEPATATDLETVREADPARRRRRRRELGLVSGVVAALAIVVLLASDGGMAPKRTTTSSPSPPPPVAASTSLRPLPDGATGAVGSAAFSGSRAHVRLRLTVRGLPPAGAGHYEAWLYNSIIDSVALGQIASGATPLDVALPADHARYRYIDISLQPPSTNPTHSGQSVLRARTIPGP